MKVKNLYAYQLENVEIAWSNLVRCEDYRSKLANIYALEQDQELRQTHLAKLVKLEEFCAAAIEAGRSIGSKGPFSSNRISASSPQDIVCRSI